MLASLFVSLISCYCFCVGGSYIPLRGCAIACVCPCVCVRSCGSEGATAFWILPRVTNSQRECHSTHTSLTVVYARVCAILVRVSFFSKIHSSRLHSWRCMPANRVSASTAPPHSPTYIPTRACACSHAHYLVCECALSNHTPTALPPSLSLCWGDHRASSKPHVSHI